MQLSFDRPHALKYSDQTILAELRRVAEIYEQRRFTRREFDQVSLSCKGSVVLSHFGSWQAALDAAGLVLAPVKKERSLISNSALFSEMERIWRRIGHRPSKDEWNSQEPVYSYTTYKTRFGGWLNACTAFVEQMSGRTEIAESHEPMRAAAPVEALDSGLTPEDRRGVPLKLRYRVLVRDNFRCVLCGRSPALEHGLRLHIDHVVPYAYGGKTNEENLRTLCDACNWGKGVEQIEQ